MIALLPSTTRYWTKIFPPELLESETGQFITLSNNVPERAPWAMDNGCWSSYRPDAIAAALRRHSASLSGCLFAVVPDAVGDAGLTVERFSAWLPDYKRSGLPLAFAIQPGVENYRIPWDEISAIFVGGGTQFKWSPIVESIATDAKRRGLWLHNGGVSTIEGVARSRALGCDSHDSTAYLYRPHDLIRAMAWHHAPIDVARLMASTKRLRPETNAQQLSLFDGEGIA